MQIYVTTPGLAGLAVLYGALGVSLLRLARITKRDAPGWACVTPGFSHWFALIGSIGIMGLMSWIWLFVGSARRDAQSQMMYAYILVVAFGIGATYCAYHISRLRTECLRWRGAAIEFEEASGATRRLLMRDFQAFRRLISGYFELTFAGGAVIRLDPYADGSGELLAALFETANEESFANSGLTRPRIPPVT